MPLQYNECFTTKWVEQLSPVDWRSKVTLRFLDVPRLLVEPAGCCLDPDVVEGWARRIDEGLPIPPPVGSLTERGTYYLHDGNHRFAAIAGSVEDTEQVRIGLVTPIAGYHFERLRRETYTTYVLAITPKRTLVTAASACIMCALALLVAAALGATVLLSTMIVVSVIWASRLAGGLAGALSTAIGAMAMAYFVFPPTRSLRVDQMADAAELVVVLLLTLWVARRFPPPKAASTYSPFGALRSFTAFKRLTDG